MAFELPPREKVGYLDPEVAGEGQKVIHSDGDVVSWTPPPANPVIPDMSQVKSLRKYFGRVGVEAWPAWLYHPTEPARLVKNANEAAELGVCYRESYPDEFARYGRKHVWDWKEDSLWRPTPQQAPKFDTKNLGQGKTLILSAPNPAIAQNELLRDLVPLVTAAVVQAVKATGAAPAPASVDPTQWEAFLQFQAWQKSQQAVNEVAADAPVPQPVGGFLTSAAVAREAAAQTGEDIERAAWAKRADELGIKIDGRWSVGRLRLEVERAEMAASAAPATETAAA